MRTYDSLLYVFDSFIPHHSSLPYAVQVLELGITQAANRAWASVSLQFYYLRVGLPFLW